MQRQQGLTLLELLVVLAIIGFGLAGVSLSLRDSNQTQLEREAQRLIAVLEAARAQSRTSGVPVRWREGRSANTLENARLSRETLARENIRRIHLVTHAWHMPRSAEQFRKAGVDCTLFPVDFRFDASRALVAIDFVPRGEAWQQTETALRECYGRLFYRLFR